MARDEKKPHDILPKNPKEVLEKAKPDEYEDPNTGFKFPVPKGAKEVLEDLED